MPLKILKYKNIAWLIAVSAILLAAVLIRLPSLTARTIHIDEGMGIRASELVLSGEWEYSPRNGHGATLFYIGAVIKKCAGMDIAAFRGFTALCMLISIISLWLFYRKELNRIGQIALLLGLGFSSGLLFFGSYFIHESLFILFTVATLLLFEHWLKTKRGVWLAFAILSGGLMYMTKETALLTWAAWVLAGLAVLVFQKNLKSLVKLATLENALFAVLGILATGAAYLFFFGKSLDLILSPYYWMHERGLLMHIKPWYYFPTMLLRHEFFLVCLGAIAAFLTAFKKQWNPRLSFFLIWFLLILLAYSAIPYKTPWLIPNMILPLGLFVAFSASSAWNKKTGRMAKDLLVFVALALFVASLNCLWLDNFARPDRAQDYDYAYLQSGKSFRSFMAILDGIIPRTTPNLQIIGNGDELLHVLTEKYKRIYEPFMQGLPAYINYFHSAEEMKRMLSQTGKEYVFLKFSYFSPGPNIDLFARKDVWDAYKLSPNFIQPDAIWPDGTLRYD